MVKCGQLIKLNNSAILVVLNVTIRLETQHSIPLLNLYDLSQVTFTFHIRTFYMVIHLRVFGLTFLCICLFPHMCNIIHTPPPPPPILHI